jgi:hypothetical protein
MATNYQKCKSTFEVTSGSATVTLNIYYRTKVFAIDGEFESGSLQINDVQRIIDVANAIRNAAEIAAIELEEKPAVNWETISPVKQEEKSWIQQAETEAVKNFTEGIAEGALSGSRENQDVKTSVEMLQKLVTPKGEFIFLNDQDEPLQIDTNHYDCLPPNTIKYMIQIAQFGGGTIHLSEGDYYSYIDEIKRKK